MPITYTNVAKPTLPIYTPQNFEGKYMWDDPGVFYDDPNVYWDGGNVNLYTKLSKPSSMSYTNVAKPT